jgi:hypothetical protein
MAAAALLVGMFGLLSTAIAEEIRGEELALPGHFKLE